jgi:methylase of polypeptide subunit release factors
VGPEVKPGTGEPARRGRSAPANRRGGAVLERLGARLQSAGYGPELLRDLLGVGLPDDVGLLNVAPMRERLRANAVPGAALVRVFYLECDERRRALEAAIARAEQDELAAAGLLALGGGRARARLRIDALAGLYVLADRRFADVDRRALELPAGDMVYPPGSDSALLVPLAALLGGRRVLDLCTGSGVQGLALARRAERVVGVDVGARAVAMARANARLNGICNFDARHGNLYGPVAGQRFDLVVANPPFVASPERGPAYHSGGPYGDRVLARVVRGLGEHLGPDGRGIAISHLALRTGERVADRVRPWLAGFRGRALALLLEEGTPVDLAAAQSLFALDRGFASYAAEVRRWVTYLARHDIARIVLLVLAVERGRRRGLEVVEAFRRTLPLPLTPPPAERLSSWLNG